MEQSSTEFVPLQMPSEKQANRRQVLLLLGVGVPLYAFYLRMLSLNCLKNHAIAFIELALATGVVYLIARYGIERPRFSRTATILPSFAAIAFRAPLICRCCVAAPIRRGCCRWCYNFLPMTC